MGWKMASWLGKTVAAGLIISFLSIWTTGYIVNSYVETLLKQFNLPLEVQPVALSGVWGGLWGADPVEEKETQTAETDKDEPADKAATEDPADEDKTGEKTAVDGSGTTTSPTSDLDETASGTDPAADEDSGSDPLAVDAFGDLPDGAVTDIGGGTGTKANSGATADDGASALDEASEGGVAMSTEEINAAKSQISDADKAELFNVMMTKLPQEAWQNISTMMEEGLTEVEMTDVQQLIAQYLSREEYDRMMEILKKY
ncbi:hypothetical protein FHS18_002958 [Paenibacillus phyllosphaerae]|uniref:Uncharacterized protein n=1 Tax=Paenibacillus phyllosphaerae TaxID=274593 RepID=A0A7W5FN28_9BACL|nr:hypothetical protein [Paenibacillus phyllosphaerae]MBB3110891.1 hypothetical protein [Paenibacillus phyllosphaerae]